MNQPEPTAAPQLATRHVTRTVTFRVIRFRLEFDCECGGHVALHPEHEQQRCHCGAIYHLANVAPIAQARLRQTRAIDATPRPRLLPAARGARAVRRARPSRSVRHALAAA